MIVVPREKVEALSDDGTRTYWDEEFSDIKWCKDEKFAFCINGVGHWLTGMPQADGIHISLGKYDYPDLYEEGVPFLMAGVIPNEILGNRGEAPKNWNFGCRPSRITAMSPRSTVTAISW